MIGSSSRAVAATALLASSFLSSASAANWTQTEVFRGNDFFTNFDWFTDRDPTNGLVNYQSQSDAQAQNLSYIDGKGHFVMAVSTTPVALEGRNSVRIVSKDSYADGVYVLNVTHVPLGCATWPAYWTVTNKLNNWPKGGEIDILENANDEYLSDLVSVHTSSSCLIPSVVSDASGTVATTNCSAYQPANPGCRVETNGTSSPTWGKALNNAGGGLVAMERSFGTTGQGIRVWIFPNNKPSAIPSDLTASSTAVSTDSWPEPNAHLPISDCYADFNPHSIVFDITLCGDWAGNTYNQSHCNLQYPSCSYQVGYNGSSFNQSYWEVESIRLYTSGGASANANNSRPQPTDQDSTSGTASSSQSTASLNTYSSAESLLKHSGIVAWAAALIASAAFVSAL